MCLPKTTRCSGLSGVLRIVHTCPRQPTPVRSARAFTDGLLALSASPVWMAPQSRGRVRVCVCVKCVCVCVFVLGGEAEGRTDRERFRGLLRLALVALVLARDVDRYLAEQTGGAALDQRLAGGQAQPVYMLAGVDIVQAVEHLF